MKKSDVLAVIQAHMPSERFPGKLLAPLFGKPLIYWTIHRALRIGCKVCAVIPEAKENDVLAAWVEQWCDVVREGCVSRRVLDCFIQAIDRYKPEAVIRLCGDAPFLDLELTAELVRRFDSSMTYGTYRVDGRPAPLLAYGVFPEIVSAEMLRILSVASIAMHQRDEIQEHVTPHFYSAGYEPVSQIMIDSESSWQFKGTIDTLEDLKRINSWVGPASWHVLTSRRDTFKFIQSIVTSENAGSPKTDYKWARVENGNTVPNQ